METPINNKWALALRGIFLISTGILLFTINRNSSNSNVLIFGLLVFLAGIAGFYFALGNKVSPLKTNWLMMESGADIVFFFVAIYFYLRSSNLTIDFMTAFACFALFFAFLQIIYIFQISQIGLMPNIKRILVSVLLAIIYSVFGIVLLFKSSFPESTTVLINFVGIGPLLAGIALLALSSKMYSLKQNAA